MPAMTGDSEYQRVRWHSRRGMLELDLVLEPFVTHCYPGLSEQKQACYRRLLESEDQDLFNWFLGRVRPTDRELAEMVDQILEHARS